MPVVRTSEVPPPELQQGGSTAGYLQGPSFGSISYFPSTGEVPCLPGQVFVPVGGECINPDVCYGNCLAGDSGAASGLPPPTLGTRGGPEDAGQLAVEEPTLGVRGAAGGEVPPEIPPGPPIPTTLPARNILLTFAVLGTLAYLATRSAPAPVASR